VEYNTSKDFALKLDKADRPSYRDHFHIPEINGEQVIYLCGNSLGLQPKKAREYVAQEMDDWAKLGVEGHFQARHPWMPYHEFLTENMAELVGAQPIEVVVMNSLTVNLHLLLVSFYRPDNRKNKIVIEHDIFPSDLYAIESQVRFHGLDPESTIIHWKPKPGRYCLEMEDYEKIMEEQGDAVALVFLGGVNYYTGQFLNIPEITRIAHLHKATAGFDLAHAAGNLPLKLHLSGADFAAWCSYKYLNSGPGSLSGIFIHERHAFQFQLPRFAGWWGHNKETRFGMRDSFDPLPGAEGWQLSNPPILPMAAMRASLEEFSNAGMSNLREKSILLTGYLAFLLDKQAHDSFEIITPKNSSSRGCQLSIHVKEKGKEVFDQISKAGVIADWREPDVIRVAPVPLYNSYLDVWRFAQMLGAYA
jgi:kynureninase